MPVDYLFVVRHGETEANELDIEAGPLDYPLIKRGIKDASFISKALSDIKFAGIYSSPVLRAVETAKILARPHGLKVRKLEDLTEAKVKPEIAGKIGRHHIITTPDAFMETYKQLQERAVKAVRFIKKEAEGNAIMVSHGQVIEALLDSVVQGKVGSYRGDIIHSDTAALSIVKLIGKPYLVLFNYHRKLLDGY